MSEDKGKNAAQERGQGDTDLGDMLQEMRVLIQGAQVLTAFLIILPFNQGFEKIDDAERWVYLTTFVSSVLSLVLFSAPAAMHRVIRPLRDRERFKNIGTRLILAAQVFASLALVLAVQLVVSQVLGFGASLLAAGAVALVVLALWWVLPLVLKRDM
ncbi:MAG TPA: DUF6328 family protein [Chloroflexia bacterium]|nr:DUF6328 family protein [Chloroflexia bacterium]